MTIDIPMQKSIFVTPKVAEMALYGGCVNEKYPEKILKGLAIFLKAKLDKQVVL